MSGSSGDMGNLLRQAQKMQAEIDRMEAELEETRLEGTSAGGAIRATVTGAGQVLRIEISDGIFDSTTKQQFEEFLTQAVRSGIERAHQLKKERMKQAMGGLDLPGLF